MQSGFFFLSGRPGSNRPPRPWQGRALPNELLPLVRFGIAKIGNCFNSANYILIKLKKKFRL